MALHAIPILGQMRKLMLGSSIYGLVVSAIPGLTSIMVQSITRTVAHFRVHGVYSSPTRIMVHLPWASQVEDTSVKLPPTGCNTGQGPRLDFYNHPGNNLSSGRILDNWRLFESD